MSDSPLEPMDPGLRALLKRAAPGAEVPADAPARLLARLSTSVAAAGLAGAAAGVAAGAVGRPASAAVTGKLVAAIALAFALGGGVGAGALWMARPERVRTVYVDRVVTTPASAAPVPAVPSAMRVEELPIEATPRPAEPVAEANPLVAERKLLDVARSAFTRGDLTDCLTALDAHRAKYPAGVLTEEREALAVRTLAALGRTERARARGEHFRTKYPTSLMLPVVEAALQSH